MADRTYKVEKGLRALTQLRALPTRPNNLRGILADRHSMRHLCDLEAISALEGTAGMHTLVLGQEITKISAFS